ncbi:MAG: NAD(P)/FAD-dependent oxidoreductase [Nitrososphaerota archaeon]|nr:NAD(P)/FAD-dependent oxidoreductase [Nitrososphaerota archaeon]
MPQDVAYDVVVVGGGPAGSSAARAAALSGLRVALLEQEEAIAQHVRTSGVTWTDHMEAQGVPAELYHPLSGFSFFSPGNEVVIRGSEAKAAVLDVRRTYQFLAQRAAEAGAEIHLKARVHGVLREGVRTAGVVASTLHGDVAFRSKVVIDASGARTVVGRDVGVAGEWERFGVGAEFEATVEAVDEDSWTLMVGQEYSPAGYAWIFPLGRNRARIGVGVGRPESTANPVQRLLELLEKRPRPLDRLGRVSPLEFHYGLVPNEGLRGKLVADGLLMAGDAAGQSNPLVLEGIRYAVAFGELAGSTAARAVKEGRTDSAALQSYEEECSRRVRRKIEAAVKVQRRWLRLDDRGWDEEIEILRGLSQDEFLDFIRADFGLSSMVKVAARHPRLAARQLFGMVKDALYPG